MDIFEAMEARHSVRQYLDSGLDPAAEAALRDEIAACNEEGGLHIQLITDEPGAFSNFLAHYGRFSGVRSYIAMVGKKGPELEEQLGYYGQRLVLKAQMLGLNTCWVALTFSKGKSRAAVGAGEKLVCVISVGCGANQGVPHKNRPMESLYRAEGPLPEWFRRGMEAAMLAPTATNQQRFLLTLRGGEVLAEATGGFYSKVDLGIVKYHFEVGAGTDRFRWAQAR